MRFLFLLLLLVSCSKKYQTFHVIKKTGFDFRDQKEQNIITPKMYPGKKIERNFCTGQILFGSNAEVEAQKELNQLVRFSCPDSDYLLNSKVTETWWTTLFYSRACIKLESFCPVYTID
jgi:hypothetical protein